MHYPYEQVTIEDSGQGVFDLTQTRNREDWMKPA